MHISFNNHVNAVLSTHAVLSILKQIYDSTGRAKTGQILGELASPNDLTLMREKRKDTKF